MDGPLYKISSCPQGPWKNGESGSAAYHLPGVTAPLTYVWNSSLLAQVLATCQLPVCLESPLPREVSCAKPDTAYACIYVGRGALLLKETIYFALTTKTSSRLNYSIFTHLATCAMQEYF